MTKWNTYTIGTIFKIFIIGFVLLPSMMVVAVAFYEFYNTKKENISHLQDIISLQREVIDDWITDQSFQVRGVAELDFVRQRDKESMNKNFTVILKNQKDISTLAYANKEGTIEASDLPTSIINDNIATRDYFQQAMSGKHYISDVLFSRTTNQPMIVFASPVRAFTGEIQGVVYGIVRLTTVNTLMEKFKFGQTGKFYLISPEGKMIAGSHNEVGIQSSDVSAKVNMIKGRINNYGITEALEGKSDNSVYEDYNGKKVLGTYQQIDRTQWAIIGEIDESEILKPFYHHLEFIAIIYLLALLFMIPITLLLYKKIIMPFESLIYGSKAIEMGDYSHRVPQSMISSAPQELQQLCERFGHMSTTIQNNIEVLYETNQVLAEEEMKYRTLVESVLVGVYIIQDGICTYSNPYLANLFGYTPVELMEEKLRYLSFHDQLTGLYNRNYFEEISRERMNEHYTRMGIIVCDLDKLKLVNDTLGHQQGDKVLKEVAKVLQKCFHGDEIIARIGGDEFIVLLYDCSPIEIADAKQRIHDQINIFNLENRDTKLSMSIGMAASGDEFIHLKDLFNEADINMYVEKRERYDKNN